MGARDPHRSRFGRLRRRRGRGGLWRRGRRHARPYRRSLRAGLGDRDGLRRGPLQMPAPRRARPRPRHAGLDRPRAAGFDLSPRRAANGATASRPRAARTRRRAIGRSPARRSTSTGAIFRETIPAFPAALTDGADRRGRTAGILANRHASGTAIIEELGEEHLRTGKPICYTSADSVFQIAAHEEAFGLERLYDLCRIARRLCDPLNIGRVIARPFVGTTRRRTSSARRIARISPCRRRTAISRSAPRRRAARSSRSARSATFSPIATPGASVKGKSNDGNVDLCSRRCSETPDGGLIFVNLVDFDTEWGHRRDVPGFAACLEAFDRRLDEIEAAMRPTTIASSPPTTATTRPTRASTTRASTCRSSPSAPARRPVRSARGRRSPTSPRRSRPSWACRRGRTARAWAA